MKKEMIFKFDNSLINKKYILQQGRKLVPLISEINNSLKYEYNTNYAFLHSLLDKTLLQKIEKLTKKHKKIKNILIIGIGGSNLGTIALSEAIKGKLNNQINNKKIYFADTTDPDYLNSIIKILKNKSILVNIITKSGTTIETIANFEAIIKYLKINKKYIIVTTDYNSTLYHLAKKKKFTVLEIPKNIGGRYSVFSVVSLFPLSLLDIKIKELINGALDIQRKCLNGNIIKNQAAISAIILFLKRKPIYDNFFFSNDLESLGKWYKQLLAESIGKNGKGITPIVSIGSTDLHSMYQLNLDGPRDKFTTFIIINRFNSEITMNSKNFKTKKFSLILNKIAKAVKLTYKKKNLPFTEIILQDKSEYSLGQFLQFKMFETIYLAKLMNVNPFDQPAVELYKEEVKKLI